jgi:hypothetical protein
MEFWREIARLRAIITVIVATASLLQPSACSLRLVLAL